MKNAYCTNNIFETIFSYLTKHFSFMTDSNYVKYYNLSVKNKNLF